MAFLQREIHSPLIYETDDLYTPALKIGDFLFLSGILPNDRKGVMKEGKEEQISQIFHNMECILSELSLDLHDLMKITVYLTDPNDKDLFLCIARDYLKAPHPASSFVYVKALDQNASIMVDGIAINTHSIKAQEDEYHQEGAETVQSHCSTCAAAPTCTRKKV